jgi:type II secretory pathway component PulJ
VARAGSGFTLVEMLVAGLLFTAVVTATYTSFRIGMDAYRECEAGLRQNQEAEIIYKYLAQDLQSARLDPANESMFFRAGKPQTDDLLWKCQLFSAEEAFDLGDNVYGTPCLIEYTLKWSDAEHASKSLYRKVVCVINDKIIAESAPYLISDNIQDFAVQFLSSGDKWQDTWNSTKAVPQAVKALVKLSGQQYSEQSYSYVFMNLAGDIKEQ